MGVREAIGAQTILLLISDPVMRTVMSEVLLRDGYGVLEAGDVGKAVDWLKLSTPDLLIVRPDIDAMPGHLAARYLRTRCPGLPVLMVGGLVDDDRLTIRASQEGFEVFPEPFPAQLLIDRVRQVLARTGGRRYPQAGEPALEKSG